MTEGVVYIAKPIGLAEYKVGHTINLDQRMKHIAASFPRGIELLAEINGGRKAERSLLKSMSKFRLHGEWFSENSIIVEAIAANQKSWLPRTYGVSKTFVDFPCLDPIDQDKQILHDMLFLLVDEASAYKTKACILNDIFNDLFKISNRWTQRRVKTLWARDCKNVKLFEVRHVARLLKDKGIGVPYELSRRIAPWIEEDTDD